MYTITMYIIFKSIFFLNIKSFKKLNKMRVNLIIISFNIKYIN